MPCRVPGTERCGSGILVDRPNDCVTFEGHTDWVSAVAVTPDGHFVVSASRDQTLRLWDLKSRKTIRKFKGHADAVFAVAVTPDGRCAISGSKDRTLRLWDLKSGKTIRKFEGHTDEVYAVAVTSDGRFVVSGSEDHTLRLWNIKRKKAIAIFTGESAMRSCAIARNGRTIIAGDDTGRVYFVSVVELDETKSAFGDTKIQLLHRYEQWPQYKTSAPGPITSGSSPGSSETFPPRRPQSNKSGGCGPPRTSYAGSRYESPSPPTRQISRTKMNSIQSKSRYEM